MQTVFETVGLDLPEAVKLLSSSEKGLSEQEAKKRLVTYGPNSLRNNKERSLILEFLNNFANPLVITLMVIAIISFIIGNSVDGIIVVVMIALSVTLNFVQEYKASRATEELSSHVAHMATVVRNGVVTEVPAISIVPGDVLELNAGDVIAADARILETKHFFVNQSALTGESFPIEKGSQSIDGKVRDLSEMVNTVFMATSVHTGWAHK